MGETPSGLPASTPTGRVSVLWGSPSRTRWEIGPAPTSWSTCLFQYQEIRWVPSLYRILWVAARAGAPGRTTANAAIKARTGAARLILFPLPRSEELPTTHSLSLNASGAGGQ